MHPGIEQPDIKKPSFAVVFGGTGAVGSEVLNLLSQENIKTAFTYFSSEEKAKELAKNLSQMAYQIDLSKPEGIKNIFCDFDDRKLLPDILVYCAGVNCTKPLQLTTTEDWQTMQAVNCQSAFVAIQEFSRRIQDRKDGANIVLLGALDRTQSIPLPVAFAATQGALSSMTMAFAKELGSKNIRINLLTLGATGGGMSRDLQPELLANYKKFSALRRVAKPIEVAHSAMWLAVENTYMSGKVFSVNGGI